MGTIQNSGMRPIKAGLIYFLLVFASGWVLGPIRELWVVFAAGASRGRPLVGPPDKAESRLQTGPPAQRDGLGYS
jgi:hypothetical protein